MKHILVDALVICLLFNTKEFTLHTYWASWNEARYICEAENGSLVEDGSPERKNMLMYYIENDMGPPRNFWIGLHYVSKLTGGASEWVWPSCIRQNLTQYSNWDYLEPQRSCVYYNVYGAEWSTDFCDEELSFVCEKMIDSPCTFTQTSGFPDYSIAYKIQVRSVEDVDECLSQCLSEMFNNTNCWAANLISGQCILYYTDDPFLFKIALGSSSDPIPFYTKNCYTASKDISDNTPHDPNINSQPDQHCDKFEDRNTQDEDDGSNVLTVASTTSTSTAGPTTSTAVAPTTSTAVAPTTSTAVAPTTSTAAAPTTSTAAAPTTSTAAAPTTSTAAAPTTSTAAASTTSTAAASTTSTAAASTTSTAAAPTTSTAAAPTTSTAAAPTTSTAAAPTTSTAAPTTSTAAAPTTSTAAAPTTSTAAAPTTSTAAVPTTSTAAVPTTSTAAAPTTSTAAVPTTSTAAVPTTSTAAVPTTSMATSSSSSYVIITLSTSPTTSTATTSPASSPISTTPGTSINPTLSTTSGTLSSSAFVSTSTSTVTVTVSSTTPIVSSTVSSATTSNVTANSTCLCMCACDVVQDTSNLTVVEKVEQIIAKLRVDKKKLSSTTRKKTCAEDERTSAKSVGYVAVVFITAELSTVFIPDLVQMGKFIYLKIMK